MVIKLFDVVQMKNGKLVTVLSFHPPGTKPRSKVAFDSGAIEFTGATACEYGAYLAEDIARVLTPDEYPQLHVPNACGDKE